MLKKVWQPVGLQDGPGTVPQPHTHSAGTLAYVVWYAMHCETAGPGIMTGANPYEEVLPTTYPSLVVASQQQDDSFLDPIKNLFSVFGAPTVQDGTLDSFAECCEEQAAPLRLEFGPTVNVSALENLDLTDLPPIFEWFRQEYLCIFRDFVPYVPARYLVSVNGFNAALVNQLHDMFENEPPDHPCHVLERWWIHAGRTAALDVIRGKKP